MRDKNLSSVDFIPESVAAKLENLEIHTILQLAGRMESGLNELAAYLELDPEDYKLIERRTLELIRKEFPGHLPDIVPRRFRNGVAVDRLGGGNRPRYYGDEDES